MSIERYLALAERVIALIRPKFYNRITWVTLLAGLLLLAAPWWADVVNALIAKHLSVTLPAPSGQFPWGFALIALALGYHVIVHSFSEYLQERKSSGAAQAKLEHDRLILEGFFGRVTERDLQSTLEFIASQHAYWDKHSRRLENAVDYLSAPSTEFLDLDVLESARSLAKSIRKLNQFLGVNFFEFNSPEEGDLRYCMHPELNVDRARTHPSLEQQDRYDKLSEELDATVRAVENGYREFRRTAKERLAA